MGGLPEAFLSRLDRSTGPDGCWPWLRGKTAAGYGMMWVEGKLQYAHRRAHFLSTGKAPQEVLHRCDNPSCCNPAHLVGGTHADNMADMRAKGRGFAPPPPRRGEASNLAKLSDDQAAAVAREVASGAHPRDVARRYGVTRQAITYIARRRAQEN